MKFEQRPLAIVDSDTQYVGWQRVDEEFRWAPGLCRAPMAAPESGRAVPFLRRLAVLSLRQ